MINKFKINTISLWLINIIYIFSFFSWLLFNWNNQSTIANYDAKLFPWVLGLIFVQMFSFRIRRVPFYDFGLWFSVISYLFMFGFMFREIFDLQSVLLWNPISSYTDIELFKSYIFVMLSLEMFSFGYLIVYSRKLILIKENLKKFEPSKKLYNIGGVLFVIGGLAKIINDIQIVFITQSANSYSAYSGAVGSGIFDDLAYLMLPGVFFLFYSGCIKEKTKKLIFFLVLIYLVGMMILTGSRKVQIFSILALFLGYEFSVERKHLSLRRIIIYSFLAVIIINIIIIIRNNRFDLASIGPIILENIFSLNLFGNILGETFAETGITILSVASIIKVVPAYKPFQYGMTFLRTIPSFLPIGWLVGDFLSQASSTYVINEYTKIPVGSSFLGDLYWNWGYIGGTLAAFLSGIIIFKVMNINNKYDIRKGCAMYFSIFSQLIILVRGELFDVFRPIVMLIFVVFIFEHTNISKMRIKIK